MTSSYLQVFLITFAAWRPLLRNPLEEELGVSHVAGGAMDVNVVIDRLSGIGRFQRGGSGGRHVATTMHDDGVNGDNAGAGVPVLGRLAEHLRAPVGAADLTTSKVDRLNRGRQHAATKRKLDDAVIQKETIDEAWNSSVARRRSDQAPGTWQVEKNVDSRTQQMVSILRGPSMQQSHPVLQRPRRIVHYQPTR